MLLRNSESDINKTEEGNYTFVSHCGISVALEELKATDFSWYGLEDSAHFKYDDCITYYSSSESVQVRISELRFKWSFTLATFEGYILL